MELTHIATAQDKPLRLQEYGVGIFHACATKSALKKALKKRLILVNGEVASTATYINGGEKIVLLEEQLPKPGRKLVLALKVHFEDDFLAVVEKPAGILVSGNSFKTLVNALDQNLQRSSQPDACAFQPIHRLDYPTTGLVLIGKTSTAIRLLGQSFADKEVHKTYYAISIGEIIKDAGTIDSSIDGKEAISRYKVMDRVSSVRFKSLNLLRLNPLTGRRHQLRKHLAAMGTPILGDKEYTPENLILMGKGLYLHALKLSFPHPITGEKMLIEGAIPAKFKKIFPGISDWASEKTEQ